MGSFIELIKTKVKTVEGISNMILNNLEVDVLHINNCRG